MAAKHIWRRAISVGNCSANNRRVLLSWTQLQKSSSNSSGIRFGVFVRSPICYIPISQPSVPWRTIAFSGPAASKDCQRYKGPVLPERRLQLAFRLFPFIKYHWYVALYCILEPCSSTDTSSVTDRSKMSKMWHELTPSQEIVKRLLLLCRASIHRRQRRLIHLADD